MFTYIWGLLMNKLLIVEDEKMIRQGIKAIALRSTVPINEVIECKNGLEALEVLKSQTIDVMITDIRMPKMDGITLVKEIQGLAHIPKVVVISGYDDFSYAVELLRHGAKEYLLKPVDRDKISEILNRLEKELVEEEKEKLKSVKMGYQQIKYILLNTIQEQEIMTVENYVSDYFMNNAYYLCCTNYNRELESIIQDVIYISDINDQGVFIVKEENLDEILNGTLQGYYVGVSKIHHGIEELRQAYFEAFSARKQAFIKAVSKFQYEIDKEVALEVISEEELEQLTQMLGTGKFTEVTKFLSHLQYKVKQGILDPDTFTSFILIMVEHICLTYKNIVEIDCTDMKVLNEVYQFDTIDSYYESLLFWLETVHKKITQEFGDYKNKQKIQKAVIYIQENYNKELNMAVVSNYISMNYSLFSFVFKQYTGMNFVNYLKTIRINEAKKLLASTDKKIIEISTIVGYENEKHFMKTFKTMYGVSPSEYRKNIQIGNLSLLP